MRQHTQYRAAVRAKPLAAVALAVVLALSACGQQAGDAAGKQAPPPPMVSVITVTPGTVAISTDLPGRLAPVREAEVRARASGIVQRRLFTEGSYVQAGQPLFQIDNAPYVANLETARASLATAEATLAKASADVNRYRPLVAADAISKQEFDAAIAQQRLAQAQVRAAKAAIQTAQINVGYARVSAPISGRIGRALVTEGALVGQGEATKLALIQQTDRLYVNLSQSAAEVTKLRQAAAAGQLQVVDGQAQVRIVLEDGSEYAHPGRLLFTDATVDAATGQVTLRAEVPNPDNLLLPGMYVRVQVPQAQLQNAILVPQQAVNRGSTGDTVMVANADGSFAPRPVKVAGAQGNQWVVVDGLKAGEKVIVDGMSLVQMSGAKKIQTQPWQAPKPATAPVQAASAAPNAASAASASK